MINTSVSIMRVFETLLDTRLFRAFIDQITQHANDGRNTGHHKNNHQHERHQNDPPRNGSILPQYKIVIHRNNAELAITLAVRGASSPAFSVHVSSNMVK